MVKIDERGRMTIPKQLRVRSTKAIVISAGTFLITIPLPTKLYEYVSSWLPSKRGRKELKILAEKSAAEDAIKRARRRQI